jgi:pentatricopeptide repeat protein
MSNNMPEKVLELYENISIEINEVIILLLFNACAKLSNAHAMKLGKDTLNRLPSSFYRSEILVNSVIDMFMKFGHISDGERLFNQIKNKSIVTYGVMMQGNCENRSLHYEIFVLGYVTNNLFEKALDLFEEVSSRSNEFTYAIVFNACASLCNERAVKSGKRFFLQMPKTFYNNVVVVNSVLHMLMKFGEIENAEHLFSQMKKRTVYTYTIMLNGYKINNQPHQCLALFEQMKQQKMIMDSPIALALVGACSQIGMRSRSENIVRHISHIQDNLHLNTSLIDMWVSSFTLLMLIFHYR